MLLELKNVTKQFKIDKFNSFNALENVRLGFNRGEFVAILGPSGSGKSTLLNIIAGLDKLSSGDLIIDNNKTTKYKAKNWDLYRKNNIGFVFQQFNLISHLTALENVEIPMSLSGLSKKKRRKRALELLEKVGIDNKRAMHLPDELSGGQKQRVAIARALANNPDIILADEPTGALDSKTGIIIMDLLKEICHDKLIIMVTHNEKLAKEYANRIVKMSDGIVQSDEIVYENEDVVSNDTLKKKNKTMPFSEAFKLSLRNMKKKLGRVLMTAIAGAIGICGITLVLGLSNGANIFIDDQLVRFGSSNVLDVSKNIKDGKDLKKVENINEFDFLSENDNFVAIREKLPVNGSWKVNNTSLDTQVNALSDAKNQEFIKKYLEGNLPKEDTNEILINKSLARNALDALNINKEEYSKILNKEITYDLNSLGINKTINFKVVGIIDEIDIDQAYLYYDYKYMDNYLNNTKIFNKSLKELLTQEKGNFEVIIKDSSKLVNFRNWVYDHENINSSSVVSINSNSNSVMSSMLNNKEGINISSFALLFHSAFSMIINVVQLVMMAFLIVALIVSSILIAIVLFSSVLERKTEIGILKAIGARKKDIIRVFNSEAILIGIFSAIIGIVAAFCLVPIAERVITNLTGYDFINVIKIPLSNNINLFGVDLTIPLFSIVGLIIISALIALIAGYLPSRKATKLQVIDALRDE